MIEALSAMLTEHIGKLFAPIRDDARMRQGSALAPAVDPA